MDVDADATTPMATRKPWPPSAESKDDWQERYVSLVSALDALLEDLIDLGTSIGIQPESMPTIENDTFDDYEG